MSVYKPKKSPYYSYDFQLDGRRFHGTTKAKGRRDAEAIERAERDRAKKAIEAEKAASGNGPLTIDVATARYWTEVGQHHSGADTTWTNLARLVDYFGPAKRLIDITGDEVAHLVAWRRSQTVGGRRTVRDPAKPNHLKPAPLVSNATVNRSTIEPLQKLFTRARTVWRVPVPDEPRWRDHLLSEPKERVREVRAAEEDAVEAAIRPDYLPLVRFARAAGLRMAECLLKKAEVDLVAGRIETRGKGKKPIRQPITTEMRAILMAAMANPTPSVFTYRAARAKRTGKRTWAKGDQLPITPSGLKSLWRRARHRRSGPTLPADLRFHDLRHDFATKLLRETGNIRLVQRALHHSRIETTTKYAHVLDEEVAAGMESAGKSRKKSRTTRQRAS